MNLAQSSDEGSPCVELATQYALESMIAYREFHSEESLRRASRIGVRALRSLQFSIDSSPDNEDKLYLVIAMMLHYAAEVSPSFGHALHLLAD